MNTKGLFLVLMLAAVLTGCGKRPEPRHLVILIDVSGSIERDALEQAFEAIDGLVGHLHRGDKIAIIPILGDAQAEASGRIIRFEVPINRQAYDSDLRSFRTRLRASLEEMKSTAIAHPGSKTDILGTIALAQQEFQSATGRSKRMLVILRDFIQEDRDFNFKTDNRVANRAAANEFATQASRTSAFDLKGMAVYLGMLRSKEYPALGRNGREAIQEFWVRYFKHSGAETRFLTDGPSLFQSAEP